MDAEKVNALLADHQMFHSEFQMDYFITIAAGGGHPYGQYKQALRELNGRNQSLQNLTSELELCEIDIGQITETLADLNTRTRMDQWEVRRNKVKLYQKLNQKKQTEATIADTRREFEYFANQCAMLKPIIGELTAERRRALELAYWNYQLRFMAAMDCATRGAPGPELIRLLSSVPKEMRRTILNELAPENRGQLTTWLMNVEVGLPQRKELPDATGETEAMADLPSCCEAK